MSTAAYQELWQRIVEKLGPPPEAGTARYIGPDTSLGILISEADVEDLWAFRIAAPEGYYARELGDGRRVLCDHDPYAVEKLDPFPRACGHEMALRVPIVRGKPLSEEKRAEIREQYGARSCARCR
jgi:hypothetical protein